MTEPQHHAVWIAVWEFQVRPESIAEFERAYGPDGLWAELFRRSSAFLGTELLRNRDRVGRYLTIDRWASREALKRFKEQYSEEYAALDRALEKLTEREALVGDFETIHAEHGGLLGCIGHDSGSQVNDLSTNPIHFEGFGKSK